MTNKTHSLIIEKKPRKNMSAGQIIISEQEIKKALTAIAPIISKDNQNQELIVVGILNGACLVTADLQRELYRAGSKNIKIHFVKVKSYLSGTESSKKPTLVSDIDFDPKNKHILLVDDIIDTGITLKFLHNSFIQKGAASVRSFALISKPDRREVEFEPDYICFEIPNVWVQGYGMDTNELGRNNPDIIIGPA